MDEILKFIGTGLGKFIVAGGAIGVAALKHIITKWNISSRINQNKLKRDVANIAKIAVDDLVRSIQIITKGNRVNLWQYSNGDKDLNNICFERVTCASEKTDRTTTGVMADFQMVLLDSYMRKIIARISDCNDDYLMVDIEDENYDDRITMELYGNSTSYHFKVFKNNVWKGVISISFIKQTKLSEDILHEVLVFVSSIRKLHEKMIN